MNIYHLAIKENFYIRFFVTLLSEPLYIFEDIEKYFKVNSTCAYNVYNIDHHREGHGSTAFSASTTATRMAKVTTGAGQVLGLLYEHFYTHLFVTNIL